MGVESDRILDGNWVSVPIRGLFDLTFGSKRATLFLMDLGFRPHQGII